MIYFVRHGETDFNKFNITQGQTDTSLNIAGLKQAELLSEVLKSYDFDIVFCSSLTRAKQTCDYIMKYHSCPVVYDERLVEISKGSLETNKNSKETYDQFFKNPHKFGGENKEDLFKRMGSFLNDLQKYKNKNILIVGHGGSFEYLKHLLLKKDPNTEEVERPYTANCEIIKFDF